MPDATPDPSGLTYVSDDEPGILRRRVGTGFSYRLPQGGPLRDKAVLHRIRALAIPPAWTQVWICADPQGHIQATGRDQRGRKQYRYHARWSEVRDAAKYEHMLEFAEALPGIRAQVDADMRRPGLPAERVLATVVHLLDGTLIRVGNDEYAEKNGSFGLTTLRRRHVALEGSALRFSFKGKSGRLWSLKVADRRIARIIRACQELPGQRLFQYRDDTGEVREVTSAQVNSYLRTISGRQVTAKDFRTWAGTVLTALALREVGLAESLTASRRNITAAIRQVSTRLGNTPTICRKCYVHPQVFECYVAGALTPENWLHEASDGLQTEEVAVLAILRRCLDGSSACIPEAPAQRRAPRSAEATPAAA